MERDRSYSTSPTPEIRDLLKANSDSKRTIKGWYALPNLEPIATRISLKEIGSKGATDAYKVMEPFLDNKLFKGSLRTMDVMNGCGRHCDTCCVASVLPSKMFTLESINRLFADKRFISMLQPSFRIGSTGDILDHPDAAEILRIVIQQVPGEVKIYTNYRPKDEEKLDEIIHLARINKEKVHLTVSLPWNRNDSVNDRFMEYIKRHPATFGRLKAVDQSGETRVESIYIQDVRHMEKIFSLGRVLSSSLGTGALRNHFLNEGRNRTADFSNRGSAKTYFNPDAFWLMVYGTVYESISTRLYTPLTTENAGVLTQLPFNADFPTPENWPGGREVQKPRYEVYSEIDRARKNRKMKPIIVVED